MEPTDSRTDRQDSYEDIFEFEDFFENKSETINPGFVPEGLAFWRRWRKSASA